MDLLGLQLHRLKFTGPVHVVIVIVNLDLIAKQLPHNH